MANGASPFIPPIDGIDTEGVVSIRNREDVDQILDKVQATSKVLVIGGGILGIEAAGALGKKRHRCNGW